MTKHWLRYDVLDGACKLRKPLHVLRYFAYFALSPYTGSDLIDPSVSLLISQSHTLVRVSRAACGTEDRP
jgi:hypothetical protein